MTDGHSCLLSQRSVVGIGVAKIEVKGMEDHRARSTVNIVADGEPGKGFRDPLNEIPDWT